VVRKSFLFSIIGIALFAAVSCSAIEELAATATPRVNPSQTAATAEVDPGQTPTLVSPTATIDLVSTSTVVPVPVATASTAPEPTTTPTPTLAPISTATTDPTQIPDSTPEPTQTPIPTPTPVVSSTPPAVDDHADDGTTATEIQPNVTASGWIEPASDVDWFSFSAIEGTVYQITAASFALETASDPLLTLVNHDMRNTLVVDDNGQGNNGALIEWVAPATETYYLNVTVGASGVPGRYQVAINGIEDDYASNTTDAATIVSGDSKSGQIGTRGDRDWFAFEATAGTAYRVDVSSVTLANPSLQILSSNGLRRLATDDSSDAENSTTLDWSAPESGTFYLSISASDDNATGSYGIELSASSDDYGNNSDSAALIGVPSSISGNFESIGDQDWFRFQTQLGTEYQFRLPVAPAGTRFRLFDQNGVTRLVSGADSSGGVQTIVWTAPASASFFVSVAAGSSGNLGAYTMSGVAITDDHGDSSNEPTSIFAGATVFGNLETIGDEDWFSFNASEGVLYHITTSTSSLSDANLSLVSTNGVARIMIDDSGSDDVINWMAPNSGTYFIKVRSATGLSTGAYSVRMTTTTDDYSDSSLGATEISAIGVSTTGILETSGDVDWFWFSVQPETKYIITLASGSLKTARMDLFDSMIIDGVLQSGVGFASGATLYSDVSVPAASRSVVFDGFSTFGSGRFYISVQSYLIEGIGEYALTVQTGGSSTPLTGVFETDIYENFIKLSDEDQKLGGQIGGSAPDEYGSDAETSSTIAIGSTVHGALVSGDSDWFSFVAEKGSVYRFETNIISLNDPDLRLIDVDGTSILTSDLDSGFAKSPRIEWIAPEDGTYFIEMYTRSYSGNRRTGRYWISVTTGIDGQSNSSDAAQNVALGVDGEDLITVSGDLEVSGDSDWFKFPVEKGRVYRFDATGTSLVDPDLRLLDVDGTSVLETDYDSGDGKGARIEWVAPAGGTYFLELRTRSYSGNIRTGGFIIRFSVESDDHGDDAAAATELGLTSGVTGTAVMGGDLEHRGDDDWFSIEAVEGWTYRFGVNALSLTDPEISIYELDGSNLIKTDYDSGPEKSAFLEWTASATGTYFVKVFSRTYSGNARVGTYRISVASTNDSYGGNAASAEPTLLGNSVAGYKTFGGALEYRGDQDWFEFDAVDGRTYWFEVRSSTLGTLGDPALTLIGADGTSILASEYSSGEGKEPRFKWTASANGTTYLKLYSQSYSGNPGIGSYALTISGSGDQS